MFIVDMTQNMISAGTQQLIVWFTQVLPQVFLFLILLNAITSLIGRRRVEHLAVRCGSNAFLRYMVLPFLAAVVLGNPMAISMGRYLPEEYKPAYFASVSYHCHTNSGIFQHINPAELFLWLGIANGVLARGLNVFPLAVRYLCAGLVANFISGYTTELLTRRLEKKQHIHLSTHVHLPKSGEEPPVSASVPAMDSASMAESRFRGDPAGDTAPAAAQLPDSSENDLALASPYRPITITRGDGGYGGPLTITPTEERHTVLYITGGGMEPEPLAKILALSGMTAVNGNEEDCPYETVALAVIDCGGTLRCGIYPGKGIPTVNLLATGRSGPLAKYMTEDLYVSAVTSEQVAAADPVPAKTASAGCRPEDTPANVPEGTVSEDTIPGGTPRNNSAGASAVDPKIGRTEDPAGMSAVDPKVGQTDDPAGMSAAAPSPKSGMHLLLEPAAAVSKIVSVFHQSARDAVKTCLELILPFMGFAALFIGICHGTGLTQFLAGLLKPMGTNTAGLFLTGIICSIPGLSAILGAGAVAAQMFSTVTGDLIQSGGIAPALALPALFAINCQCACDFIPVGLGMMEARPETMQLGITSVTLSRFATGWIRILIALVFSIGLYA